MGKELEDDTNENTWVCISCKTSSNKRRSTLSNIANSTNRRLTPLNNIATTRPSLGAQSKNSTTQSEKENNRVIDKLDEILIKLKLYEEQMSEVKSEISYMKSTLDSIIEQNVDLRNENAGLKEKMEKNQIEIEKLKQVHYNDTLEFSGIDETPGENTAEIITKIVNKLGVELKENDIKSTYRKNLIARNSGEPKKIIVKFKNLKVKNSIIQKKRNVRLDMLLFNSNEESNNNNSNNHNNLKTIFISEALTTYFSLLFKMARDMKRNKTVKFAWVKNGKIFIRKEENTKIIQVLKKSDLNVT